jgi:hypothetical protein
MLNSYSFYFNCYASFKKVDLNAWQTVHASKLPQPTTGSSLQLCKSMTILPSLFEREVTTI